jgi:hypothetical protein
MFNREKGSNSSFQLNPPLASRELARAHPWSIPSMLLSSQLPLVGSQDQNQYVFDRAFATQVDELPIPEEDVPFCHDCREQGHYALNCPWVYAKEAPSLGLTVQTSLNQPLRTKSSLQPSVQSREPNEENPLNPGNCFPPSPSYHVGSRTKQAKGKKSKNQRRKAPMRTEEEVRKMTITSTEWPPPGMTKRQRRNTFRGAPQLTEHLLANGGRVSDSEDSDQVSSDDEDQKSPQGFNQNKMERKACSRCGEIGHVASSCATTCVHCEEDHPPDRCPMSRITCFFCQGTDHVPKDCQFSFLLTKRMASQPASSNGEQHQGNTNPRQDYSFSLTSVPGQRNQNEERKCRVREDICCFNCQGMGHFADKWPKPRNIAAGTSVHATPCNQKLAPQRLVIHASRSSPIARVATTPIPMSALPQGVNAQFQPQPPADKTEASICVVPLEVPIQQLRNQVQDEEPECKKVIACYNCSEEGQYSKNCPQPRQNRPPHYRQFTRSRHSNRIVVTGANAVPVRPRVNQNP